MMKLARIDHRFDINECPADLLNAGRDGGSVWNWNRAAPGFMARVSGEGAASETGFTSAAALAIFGDYQAVVFRFALDAEAPLAAPKPAAAIVTCRGCRTVHPLPVRGWSEVRPAVTGAGWTYGPDGTLRETWCPQCRRTGGTE